MEFHMKPSAYKDIATTRFGSEIQQSIGRYRMNIANISCILLRYQSQI